MTQFWEKLPKPFFVMAPMADVTDPAFRALVAKHGKPDVTYTEFVSADGLYYTAFAGSPEKSSARAARPTQHDFSGLPAPALMRDLAFTEAERPIVAQMFSSKPEMIAYGANLAGELGFDGFDINMGCPADVVVRNGAGACLIQNPELAVELIKAAKAATKLPVSVKTRIGYNKVELETWLPALLKTEPAAITLHLRTKKEMSAVPAQWGLMKRAVEIRNEVAPHIPLIGNGDITDLEDAKAKVAEAGCDGAMLGRAIFGNPWVFAGRKSEDTPLAEKLAALVELAYGFEKLSPPKNFAILKKHIKAFVTGFDGAAELRAKLMAAENAKELEAGIL